MNVGSSRGAGGDGLSRHWLKAKNEEVRALEPPGVGARGDLKAQVRALTAATAHATFAQPVAHFWFPPNPADRKPTAEEKADLLARVEREFHLERQPRIGCAHVLRRDMDAAGKERHPSWEGEDRHEHYAWSLVRENGQAVDHMRKSMIRQQRVVAEWQHAHGFRITPMKHVTAVLEYLDRHKPEVAAAVRAAGMRSLNDTNPSNPPGPSAANIALYRTRERAQMERSPVVPVAAKTRHAFNVRKDVLGAWRASDDGRSFEAALGERGYRLARGAKSAMIVDPGGIEHRATELLATATRKLEGKAIAAAEVRARLTGSTWHRSSRSARPCATALPRRQPRAPRTPLRRPPSIGSPRRPRLRVRPGQPGRKPLRGKRTQLRKSFPLVQRPFRSLTRRPSSRLLPPPIPARPRHLRLPAPVAVGLSSVVEVGAGRLRRPTTTLSPRSTR